MRSKYLQKLAATALTTSLGVGAVLAGNLDQLNYLDVPGTTVESLRNPPNSAIFPNVPWEILPFVELMNPGVPVPPPTFIATTGGNPQNSATMVRGFIEPPQTGLYTFWVNGNADAELWLSTNHSVGGKTRIAYTSGVTGVGEWGRNLTQKSARINLVKGNQYYFELIQKSSGTGGHAQMGWWLPDFTLERPVPIRYAQRFAFAANCIPGSGCFGSFIPERSVPTPIFDRHPGNNTGSFDNQIFITENRSYDMSPWLTSQYPVAFQWQEMQGYTLGQQGSGTPVDLVGEITSSKYIASAKATEHNAKAYRVIARNTTTGNSSTSRVSRITVLVDFTAPSLVSASAAGSTNGFNVVFSENVDPVTATNKANYVVSNGVVVDRVEMRYGETPNNTVVVYTVGQIPGNTTVTVSDVRDLAANPNTIAANSVIDVLLTDGIISYFAYGNINGGSAIGGTDIASLINATNRFTSLSTDPANRLPFPGAPDLATTRPELGIPQNVSNDYGVLLTGFLFPPETGLYNIVIAGDDQSIVYISPTDNPATKVAVAMDPQWNGWRAYTSADRRTMGNTGNSGFISSNFPGRPVAANNAAIPSNQSKHTLGGTLLTRGNKHFIEVLMKEGGGGDNVDVTWQLPGTWNLGDNSGLVDQQAPIPGVYLSQAAAPGQSGPITIVQQPVDATTLENRPVTFSVVHGGSPSFSYQWYKNGIIIPDANARTYTEPLPDPETEDGAVYTVTVRNLFSGATSANATLTVTDDLVGPQLVRAVGSASFNSVTIWFDEVVDPATAVNAANYSIVQTGTSTQLGILSNGTMAGPGPGGFTRVVFPTGPQTQGQNYTITVSNVRDIANTANIITAASTVSFTGWVVSKGFALYEVWWDINGGNVNTVKADPRYPGNPSRTSYKTLWESDQNIAEQFGGRLSGYFFAAAGAGRYDFYMASDDNGELWIANDSNSSVAQTRLGFEPGWGNRRSWTGTSDGRRAEGDNNTVGDNLAAINMTAGERRYMELIYKEGGGGDYGDATMKTPTGAAPDNGATSTLSGPFIGALANPDETRFTFTTQPQSITTGEGTTAQFTVAGSGQTMQDQLNSPPTSSPVFWQWQWQAAGSATWTDIPGAHGTTYTTAALVPVDNGAKVRALASIPGLTSPSAEATISTVDDHTRPKITGVSIVLDPGSPFGVQNRVRVFFSEPMLRSSIETIGNYALTRGGNPVAISAAAAASDNRSVTLTMASSMVPGEQATLTATGLLDPAVAANVIDPNPTVQQFSAWVLANTIRRQLYFNINGGTLPDLTNNAAYPNSPNVDSFVSLFEERPSDQQPLSGRPGETALNRENFGTRITGLLVPTETANYHFAISGDDHQAFYLSTDANPANRRLIVAEPVWNGYRDWNTNDRRVGANNYFPSVTTLPVNRTTSLVDPVNRPDGSYALEAGVSYYAELLAKEGGGGDSTAVTWWKVGETMPANGTPAISAANVLSYQNPDNTINISAQPQSQTVNAGVNVTFSVTANPTAPYLGGPVTYQWRRGGVNIGGATTSSYTLNDAQAGDNGASFDVVLNAPGAPSVTSTAATLTVGGGVVPPPELSITRNGNNVVVSYENAAAVGGHALQKSTGLPGGFAADGSGVVNGANLEATVDVTAGGAAPQSYWRTLRP